MSVDLDWSKLDSSLANHLIDILNRQLSNTPRLSFIGPVEVTSLDFGSVPPDIRVELVDLRDIYRDFLEDYDSDDDENSERDPVKVTEGAGVDGRPPRRRRDDDDDGFEWVSRRVAAASARRDEGGLAYHHLPPHVRYGRTPTDLFIPSFALSSAPTGLHPTRAASSISLPGLSSAGVSIPPPLQYRSPTPSSPFVIQPPPVRVPPPPTPAPSNLPSRTGSPVPPPAAPHSQPKSPLLQPSHWQMTGSNGSPDERQRRVRGATKAGSHITISHRMFAMGGRQPLIHPNVLAFLRNGTVRGGVAEPESTVQT